MCGIAGRLVVDESAEPMNIGLLHHRGPDGQGEWRSPNRCVWMGSTRLAIQDLSSAGAQPMIDEETGNVIVFNGEIYNHLRLREELGTQVHGWTGTSDTETLLVAYRCWHERMVEKLSGMFAFAIYDATDGSLFIARCRFGIKTLYYVHDGSSFSFGSELKVLTDGSSISTSGEAISAYLQWGACPEEILIDPRIKVFPAGHWLRLRADAIMDLQYYWPPFKFSSRAPTEKKFEDPVKQVRKLLDTSVEEHLLSDVPVAVFLSGGVDSSVITALAAQRLEGRLATFSVGFDEATLDESRVAEVVARRYKTDHTRIELEEDEVIELVKEAVSKFDLPSVDAINTYIVSKKVAERGIKVALSGLGGDELFGGYPSFTDVWKMKLLSRIPRSLRQLVWRFGRLGELVAELPPTKDVQILARWRRRFWTEAMLRRAGLPNVPFELNRNPDLDDDFNRISWAELTGYMRHMLLRDSDQMSMAVSLELRVPFLHHDLVEYVYGLPMHLKVGGGLSKRLLVESCKDLLPEVVFERKKMGFALPMDSWMRGPLAFFVEEGLQELQERRVMLEGLTDALREQFARGQLHWTRLWSLVVLGKYLANRVKDVGK